jgi:hypothetical protein
MAALSDAKWMSGHCWDMAIALHVHTQLPLFGLFDAGGSCHHAFVWDDSRQLGIDARGTLPLAREKIEGPSGFLGRAVDTTELASAWRYAKKMRLTAGWDAARIGQETK